MANTKPTTTTTPTTTATPKPNRAARRAARHGAVLCDLEGNLTEGTGANLFIVADDTLYTPGARNILVGISIC